MVKNSKFFRTFLAHPVETPWPILTILYQNVCRSVPYILDYISHRWEKYKWYSCPMHEWDHPPIFWVFNSPSPLPQGPMDPTGEGHVDRHCPYTNNIWCGSVHALLRYRSKTAKMQKFPIDSHSNENFICRFFRLPGAANPQKGRSDVPTQATPACELWRESARWLLRNRWPNKKNKKNRINTSPIRSANGG